MAALLCGVSAYVLHARPYRNTSLILDCLTDQLGRISVIARSARGPKSRFRGQCQLFCPMLINIRSSRSLYQMVHMELQSIGPDLSGDALLCGFYINELLLALISSEQEQLELYALYERTLYGLQHGVHVSIGLRLFEKQCLSLLGYELNWSHTADEAVAIEPDCHYAFQVQYGFCESAPKPAYTYPGSALLAMHDEELTAADAQILKPLMRERIAFYLRGKSLRTRDLFK